MECRPKHERTASRKVGVVYVSSIFVVELAGLVVCKRNEVKAASVARIAGELGRSHGAKISSHRNGPACRQELRAWSRACGNPIGVERIAGGIGSDSRFDDVENAGTNRHRSRPDFSNAGLKQGWTTC